MNLNVSVPEGSDGRRRMCDKIGIPAHAEIRKGRFAQWVDDEGDFHRVDLENEGRRMFSKYCINKYGFDYEGWQNKPLFQLNGDFTNYLNGYGSYEEKQLHEWVELYLDAIMYAQTQKKDVKSGAFFVRKTLAEGVDVDWERMLYSAQLGAEPNYKRMHN